MNTVIDTLRKLFTVRTCELALSEQNVTTNKYSVCLEFHIGNCLGPCENKQSIIDYNEKIKEVKRILKGNINEAKKYFDSKIKFYSNKLEFEKAHYYKEKLDHLDNFQNRSIVSSSRDLNLKCFVIINDETHAYIHVLEIVDGSIIASKNIRAKIIFEETIEEILTHTIINEVKKTDREVISNLNLDLNFPFTYSVPVIGDKKRIIDIALKNITQFKIEKSNISKKTFSVTKELQKQLHLKNEPIHIECFDNSNIQGTNPVASMVCFKKGKPSKKDYRHYNIKTVIGPNDFDSMTEIVGRRYKRLKEEQLAYPDLIVIDGGKGQLSAAVKALKGLDLYGNIPIIGIAKRLEEIFVPNDQQALFLDKKSASLKLLQHLRNEAHRFAITFHRTKRSNNTINSEISTIEGIGDKTLSLLLKKFKSTKRIFETPEKELIDTIGVKKAKLIIAYKNKKGNQ